MMAEIKQQLHTSHSPVSSSELHAIVHSHDWLQHWNDLNEQALLKQPEPQVISNIRATAAQIMLEEKSISSQNFELMRAMNLFDRTISTHETVQAAVDSAINSLLGKIKNTITPAEPESMNLSRARKRAQDAVASPAEFAASAYAAAQFIWQSPNAAYEAIKQTASHGISNTRIDLAHSMKSTNPSRALGAAIGAGITDIAINTLQPGKIMDWNTYARLLGTGTVLPSAKPFRDFSDKMTFSKTKWSEPEVDYQAATRHGINAGINDTLGLYFGIKAEENRTRFGSGSEMFLSAVKVFHQHHIDITSLTGLWESGRLGTNHQQFMRAYQNGASLEQAASQTFTGKMAARLGLTAVDTSELQAAAAKQDLSRLTPFFLHPDWGSGDQMNSYSQVFSLAHGRPGLALVPRELPANMLHEIKQLPQQQQAVVMQRIHSNLQSQHERSSLLNAADNSAEIK